MDYKYEIVKIKQHDKGSELLNYLRNGYEILSALSVTSSSTAYNSYSEYVLRKAI